MNNVHWIVDRHILDHSENKHKIIEALDRHGKYIIRDVERFRVIDLPEEYREGPVVVYGSQQFSAAVVRDHGVAPASYYIPERFYVSHYTAHFDDHSWFLNGDYVCMPYLLLKQRLEQIYDMFGSTTLFLRPDTGKKVFTGLTIDLHSAPQEFSALEQLTSITNRTMVCVARAKKVLSEYRYVIVEGNIVAHTQYMQNGMPHASTYDNASCRQLATMVAKHNYQLDVAYVCDVALVDDEEDDAYIVEFNSVGTSGWYYADPEKIITALNDAAIKEYNGEITS